MSYLNTTKKENYDGLMLVKRFLSKCSKDKNSPLYDSSLEALNILRSAKKDDIHISKTSRDHNWIISVKKKDSYYIDLWIVYVMQDPNNTEIKIHLIF